jgi:hypothetical protein
MVISDAVTAEDFRKEVLEEINRRMDKYRKYATMLKIPTQTRVRHNHAVAVLGDLYMFLSDVQIEPRL